MITEEDKKEIDELDEVKSYFLIDMIGGILWRTNHDAGHGRITITTEMQGELNDLSEKQQYCVQQLTKFGIDPESAKNRPDGDYWKWFKHWKNWVEEMTDEVWSTFDNKMSNKEDYEDMLPKTKWNDVVE